MGNYKFRLANMMPNAWFNKLKDMSSKGTTKNNNKRRIQFSSANAATQPVAPNSYLQSPQTPRMQPNRTSYYYSGRKEAENELRNVSPLHHHPKSSDTHFPLEKPRKSKKKSRRKATKSPKLLASSGCTYRVSKASDFSSELTVDSLSLSPMSPCEFYFDNNLTSASNSCTCKVNSFENGILTDKVILDKKNKDFDEFSETELPPILTKSVKKDVFDDDKKVYQVRSNSYGHVEEKNKKIQQMKKSTSPGLHRLRMRANSPRIASRKAQGYVRRKNTALQQQQQLRNGLSESLAIVKSSADPRKDFRDSMMEMILENNIRKSKDLEDLLACYLSLNSNEYHDVIVKVFEQIWVDLPKIKL